MLANQVPPPGGLLTIRFRIVLFIDNILKWAKISFEIKVLEEAGQFAWQFFAIIGQVIDV